MSAPHTAAYSADGQTIDRPGFYAIACDPSRSVVVEACAGAGKTWMLVSRILRALLEGAEPQQVLAITFTRKAAGEMRARLNEWLAEFAEPRATHAQRVEALRQRGLDPARAEALAPALGQLHRRVLEGGRSIQVRTFHAWFSQLLRMAPLDVLAGMGLQPGMALIEDTESLRPELMRRFLRRVSGDEALRAAQQALTARHGRGLVQRWLDAAWSRRVEIERAQAAGTLLDGVEPAAAVYADCRGLDHPVALMGEAAWRDELATLAAALGAASGAKCQAAAAGLQQALAQLDADEPERALATARKAVMTDKGEPRKLPGDWPALGRVADGLEQIALRIRQHEAHEDHRRMVALSQALLEEFAALKRARALVDMSDLETAALTLLSEPEWAGFIQERLDAQLRHLLIDEFQDTSPMQWHALQPWLASYAGAGGGASGQSPLSVFIVGDPKQSIYRFRRAEPRVFAAAAEFVRDALDGRLLACDHTRRNARGVIDALNAAFAQARAAGQYPGYRDHTTEVAEAGQGVWRLPRVERPPRGARGGDGPAEWRDSLTQPRHSEQEHLGALEARWVARAIAELLAQGHRPGDIQVLARKRGTLARLSDALRVLHIPHVRPDELRLADEPEARDLIALLDALASPVHDLSLAQALRSPVFGASDEDLLRLSAEAGRDGWWGALQRLGARDDAPPALARAARLLAAWEPLARAWPPHDLLDRIVHEGDVMGRTLQAVPPERRGAARAVIEGLLAAALQTDGGRYASPYGLVRALRRDSPGVPALAQADAVQLLTVHGAKGLEAEAVFLMDCDPESRQAEAGGLLVDWPVQLDHPARVAFVASSGRRAPSLQALQDDEASENAREELNALYVALTRARQRLVISAVAPFRKAGPTAWWDRLQPLAAPWEPAAAAPPAAATAAAAQVDDWAALAPPVVEKGAGIAADWTAPVRQDSLQTRQGEAFHRLMQWACGPRGPAPGGLEDWLAAVQGAAAAEFELSPEEMDLALTAARAVLAGPSFQPWWRGPGIDWAGDEVPVTEGGEALRIDRLVCRGGTWWVLDYKLGHHPERQPEYQAQLARYVAAVRALQPGEPVRAAFVSGNGLVIEAQAVLGAE